MLMKSLSHHARCVGAHLKLHHKKYLFGSLWGFAMVKLGLLLITGASIVTLGEGQVTHAANVFCQ